MLFRVTQILIGSFLILWSVFLSLSIISFNAQDPSFNKSVDASVIHNLMGRPGAFLADPLIEIFGFACTFIIIFIASQGMKMVRSWVSLVDAIRLCIILIVLPMVMLLLAAMSKGLGGIVGSFLLNEVDLRYGAHKVWILLLLFIASCFGLFFAYGLKVKQVIKLCKILLAFIKYAANVVIWFIKMILWLQKRLLRSISQDDTSKPNIPQIKPLIEQKEKTNSQKVDVQSKLKLEPDEFELPSTILLSEASSKQKRTQMSDSALNQNSKLLHKVMEDFGIIGAITKINPGPVVTLYEFEPSAGTKSARVIGLADDIARSMSAISARIAIIPGKSALGIELPNTYRETVFLRELVESKAYRESECKLPLILGKNIGGDPVVADLSKMPHLLVAGTTGSGKSVAINTMILSLLYAHPPSECRFIMVDPKMLELSIYDGIPHLLAPVVTEPKKAVSALKWVVREMERRYKMMSLLGVRNVEGYNKSIKDAIRIGNSLDKKVQIGFDSVTGQPKYEDVQVELKTLPLIVVIVDEMADLMIVAGKEIETSIQRLAQMARAAGIHIIMATQRPSVDVITGIIKANFPTRISFQVTSKIDSRTILGEQGAEQLLGMGDMLFMRGGGRIERVHGPFVSDSEVEKIVQFLKNQGEPVYIQDITIDEDDSALPETEGSGDDLYDQALAIVLRDKKASASYIQRCLRIGYNRAATLIEKMEREGVVSTPNHVGKRDILIGE